MTCALTWIEETRELGENGRERRRIATDAECRAIVEGLGLVSCDSLEFTYTLRPLGEGRYRLRGDLCARVKQACVVTLEPVAARVDEHIDLEFWPSSLLAPHPSDGEHAILGSDEPESLGPSGQIETGRIAFEVLAAALDPYPRKDGAAFEWSEESDSAQKESPFAVLAKLKGEPKP